MKHVISAIVLVLFSVSCKQRNEGTLQESKASKKNIEESINLETKLKGNSGKLPIINEVNIDNNKIGNVNILNLIDTIICLPLQTSPDCLIGKINKICISKDRIYILDKNLARSVFAFDLKGQFVNRYARTGKGPGEFTEINDFSIKNDSVHILINNSIIGTFNKDLNQPTFKKIELWAQAIQCDLNSDGFFITGQTYQGDVGYISNMEPTAKSFLRMHNTGNMHSRYPFSIVNGDVIFYHPLLDTVYKLDRNRIESLRYIKRNREKGLYTYFENDKEIILSNFRDCFLCNKRNGSIKLVTFDSLEDDFDIIFNQYYIHGLIGDFIISKVEPIKIMSSIQNIKPNNLFYNMIKQIDLNSNPIIILTRLKED